MAYSVSNRTLINKAVLGACGIPADLNNAAAECATGIENLFMKLLRITASRKL